MGLYILLADDSEKGFDSEANWTPALFDWQQEASNVLFFTFIHPDTMEVPASYRKLAATRGTNLPGSVPADTVIMFAIGGYAYSIKPNPWHWLVTKEAAEAMAVKVAEWPEKYGCDGIDLDLEEGAGAKKEAGPNMIHFIRKLKELQPNIIISQPVYGFPQVQAETDVINASWDSKGTSANLADSIGLMVYVGTQALNYVDNYANGGGKWNGFPITASAPKNTILLGAMGQSNFKDIQSMAEEAVKQDLLGIMVWYASVKNGFDYAVNWDASTNEESIKGYKEAMKIFKASKTVRTSAPQFVPVSQIPNTRTGDSINKAGCLVGPSGERVCQQGAFGADGQSRVLARGNKGPGLTGSNGNAGPINAAGQAYDPAAETYKRQIIAYQAWAEQQVENAKRQM